MDEQFVKAEKDEKSEGAQGKRRLVIIVCALVAVAALLLALVVPSCQNPTPPRGTVVAGEGGIEETELERPESGPLAAGTLEVVNDEELYVRLVDDALKEAHDGEGEQLQLSVQVMAAGGGRVWKRTYTAEALKDQGCWGADSNEVGVALDSLGEGGRFAEQADDEGVLLGDVVEPGEDMVVYAVASYGDGAIDNTPDEDVPSKADGEGEAHEPDETDAETGAETDADDAKAETDATDAKAVGQTVNSLFAAVETGEGRKVAVVSRLRHLVNLDRATAGEGAYDAVRLDADISSAGGPWDEPASVSPASRDDGKATCPLSRLVPLNLLSGANGKDGLVDGGGHALRGLTIGDPDNRQDLTGLFASVGCEVAQLTLVDAKVYGADATGALAGELVEGARVHDCAVKLAADAGGAYRYDDYAVTGETGVGGLVGRATGATVENCVASVSVAGKEDVGGLVGTFRRGSMSRCGTHAAFVGDSGDDAYPTVRGTVSVGGLVGHADGAEAIESCHAAVGVLPLKDAAKGTSRFGGFAGILEGTSKLSGCYATGDVLAQSEAGGFCGRVDGPSISKCFATGDLCCDKRGGGFVGSVHGEGTIERSRSFGLVLNVAKKVEKSNGGFFGANSSKQADNIRDTNAYLSEPGYNDRLQADDEGHNEGRPYARTKTYRQLMDADGTGIDVEHAHPYAAELKGSVFPFEDTTGLGEIWGDWPAMRVATWYRDNGELIMEREAPIGSTPDFGESLRAAERPQDYYADQGPYYLFAGWDETFDEKGNYVATARVDKLPFHEFFPDEPKARWAAELRDALAGYVNENWRVTEDFVLDSDDPDPDTPIEPASFSYRLQGIKGGSPVLIIGQKLPEAGQEAGSYRALRFDIVPNTLESGYVTATEVSSGGNRYYAYDEFTPDPE